MSPVMPELMSLDPPLRSKIGQELQRDERLLWLGQPSPWRLVRQTLPAVLFAIPWTAFAVFWVWTAFKDTPSSPQKEWSYYPLFGVPFILIGLGMLASPLWMLRAAGRTAYLLTDRRAVIVGGVLSMTVRSFLLNRMQHITRRERQDGWGDLIFDREIVSGSEDGRHWREVGFMGIPNVRQVEQMLRDAAGAL